MLSDDHFCHCGSFKHDDQSLIEMHLVIHKMVELLLVIFGLTTFVRGVPYVTVQQGRLFGETVDFNEDGLSAKVDVFKGIPYAEPPLRFAAPELKQPWDGDWNATSYRQCCIQPPVDPWRPWELHKTVDEDCLFLNIYAPNPKPINASVMLYIHGGSYSSGTAMDNDLSGVPMVAFEGVIVVVINYRLNVFGFFSTGDSAAPGNFGLLDQAEAFKWVKDNIQAFGGDQSRVTIYGESAGAGSVDLHRFSTYSRNFFDQAILQSGTAVAWWSYRDDPELERAQAFSLGRSVNCETEDTQELVQCLRGVSADELYRAHRTSGHSWIPNRDGLFLDESPQDLLDRGEFKRSPLIVGFNKDEGTLFLPYVFPRYIGEEDPPYISRAMFDTLTSLALRRTGEFTNELIENAVKQQYIDWCKADNSSADYFLDFIPLYGDLTFSCAAMDVIRAHSFSGEDVFQYFFTHVPSTSYYERGDQGTGWFLAGHVEDVPFVFGWDFNTDIKDLHYWTTEERGLSRTMMKFWTNFAKTGDPSKTLVTDQPGTGDMEWPSFSVPDLYYKELSLDLSVRRGLKADECAFWGDFLEDVRLTLVSMDEAELEWREYYSSWKKDLNDWRNEFVSYQKNKNCP